MPSSAARSHKAESHASAIIGVVVVALIIVGLGVWFWRASVPPADYSELFWVSSPRLQGNALAFSIQLNSSESRSVRVDLNAYLNGSLAQRKIIQLEQRQHKQVDFLIPLERLPESDVEVRLVVQRFDAKGNPLRSNLEIRDWLRASGK